MITIFGLFIISERHENWKLVDYMQKCELCTEGMTVTFLNTMYTIMVQLIWSIWSILDIKCRFSEQAHSFLD